MKIKPFKDIPLKQQLISISLLTTVVALLLTGLVLIAGEIVSFRSSLVENITAQAKIIGNNSTAALTFNDQNAAEETLSALKSVPDIDFALIYAKDGSVFAKYKRKDVKKDYSPPEIREDGYDFGVEHLTLFQSIVLDNEVIGTVYIRCDLNELYKRISWNIGVVLVLLALSIFVAFLLMSKLLQSITKPMMSMVQLMKTISTTKNYTLRSSIERQDEIGVLSGGFNEMLEQIQSRDMEIKRSYEQLLQEFTVRKQAEDTIKYMAYYDSLTGLPNRSLFNDRLSQVILQAQRNNQKLAVIFLDLDRFKNINDTLGHPTGDLLLKAVADRLSKSLRQSDTISHDVIDEFTISRHGGDEFTILLPGVNHVRDAARVAQKVLDILTEKFSVGIHELFISASAGISMYPADGDNAETLVKNADIAMYTAKEHGRNNYQFFTSAMNASVFERLTVENSLRKAIKKDEFILHYQPRVDIKTGRITGMEALVRWQHPEFGLVPPAQFIPIAEETGLIIPIGEQILWKTCRQNKIWQDAGLPHLRVGVNLSARQFQQQNLVEMISLALNNTGLSSAWLEIEITESTIMKDVSRTVRVLNKIHDMGVQIAIDDFGTGYSSLSYLKAFPIDMLKIDRAFLMGVTINPNDAAIVNAIIAMAHILKLKVIAEGVETEEQLNFLRSGQCDDMQGYFFSRPLPPEELEQLLKNNPWEKEGNKSL
ncbi:MAG: EAL domain-containing protein [Nitrospirae bacterium]|nr:EAL domain-containing protein [Nitrospirota bacterium]